MSDAVLLAPLDDDGSVPAPVSAVMPTLPSSQRDWLGVQVGSWAEAAHYHPRIDLHVNANGDALGLLFNPIAWALASAWRNRVIDYPLLGLVVVTGTVDDEALLYRPLAPLCLKQVETVAAAVRTAWNAAPGGHGMRLPLHELFAIAHAASAPRV